MSDTKQPTPYREPENEELEELQVLIECSREMARTRNQIMNPRLPSAFEDAVETALGILIRHRQRDLEGR